MTRTLPLTYGACNESGFSRETEPIRYLCYWFLLFEFALKIREAKKSHNLPSPKTWELLEPTVKVPV